jgi:hypothetical protein
MQFVHNGMQAVALNLESEVNRDLTMNVRLAAGI